MVTTLELQRRGLRYGVIVDAAVTQATLDDLDRRGLRYQAEVASGVTAADRATLERRGLQYFVPVAVGVAEADKASLDRQGLRYAVQVDADILPADRAILERQGLRYFVEVDSSGNSVATAAGGAILLVDETNGFATDFTHAVDAERVAVKTAGTVVASAVDGFFTNAGTSPKMVYDVAGTLGWSPHNLVLQSQSFDHASWGKEQSTVTANAAIAPDGTTTADKLVEDSSAGAHDIGQAFALTTGTYSVYAKAAERSAIMFYDGVAGKGDAFNLSAGTTFVDGGIPTTGGAVIQSVGNGWYRCSMPITASTVANIYTHNGTTYLYTGNGSSGVYLWGAQVNKGTVPTSYLPTTTAARYGLAIDYDPVTHAAKGLLCEPAATNLIISSADMAVGWGPVGVTFVQDTTTSPAGVLEADTVTFGAGAGTYIYNQAAGSVTSGIAYTFSTFAKTASGTKKFRFGFNAAAAVLSPDFTATTAWQRFSHTFTADTTGDAYCLLNNEAAGGVGDVVFWGSQLEVGTVATSPIPTTSATVTRVADAVSAAPASIGYSTTAGSWRVEATINAFISNARIIGLQTGTAPIYQNAATSFGFWDGPWFGSKTVASILGSHKVAVALADANRAGTADGLAVSANAAAGALSSAGTRIGFGCDSTIALGGDWSNVYIRKVVYVPRRKSNAELVTETT